MIDQKRLEKLVQLMVDHDLSELDIRDKDETVALKRAYASASPPVSAPTSTNASTEIAATPAAPTSADTDLLAVESPMVGTFYAQSNPESDAFVKVGSPVGPDSVVCIIEAMKVFNEVQAGVAGTIERVLVDNGDPVEFGQKLYLVRPN